MEKWLRQSINFTVRLGEISLFTWPLSACVLKIHFTKLPAHPAIPAELPELFRDSVDVVVTRSHPVESLLTGLSLLPQAIQYVPSSYQRYWVVFDGDFENYLKKFSAKSRNTLLRKIKNLRNFQEEKSIGKSIANRKKYVSSISWQWKFRKDLSGATTGLWFAC